MNKICREGLVGTYNAKDRQDGSTTQGGYSNDIVVAANSSAIAR